MTNEDLLGAYEAALRSQAEADVKVKVLEMRCSLVSLATAPSPVKEPLAPRGPTNQAKFTEKHKASLVIDDIVLLKEAERSPAEIASHLGTMKRFLDIHVNSVLRYLRQGKLRHGPTSNRGSGGKKTIDTISVVEWVYGLNGETKEE